MKKQKIVHFTDNATSNIPDFGEQPKDLFPDCGSMKLYDVPDFSTPTTPSPRVAFLKGIEKTYTDCVSIVRNKNRDYANEFDPFLNFRNASVVGVSPERAILVRIMDKISRISNLIDKDADVKDETIEDTIHDAINYLAILKEKIKN